MNLNLTKSAADFSIILEVLVWKFEPFLLAKLIIWFNYYKIQKSVYILRARYHSIISIEYLICFLRQVYSLLAWFILFAGPIGWAPNTRGVRGCLAHREFPSATSAAASSLSPSGPLRWWTRRFAYRTIRCCYCSLPSCPKDSCY